MLDYWPTWFGWFHKHFVALFRQHSDPFTVTKNQHFVLIADIDVNWNIMSCFCLPWLLFLKCSIRWKCQTSSRWFIERTVFVGQIKRTLSESYGFPSSLCRLLVHRAGNTLFGLGWGLEWKKLNARRFSKARLLQTHSSSSWWFRV